MRTFVFSPRAERDLDHIWDYTYDRWGRDQADLYTVSFREACRALCRSEIRGTPIDDVRVGYLKYGVGSHVLIFRITRHRLNIIRVLHESMDFKRHLK